MLKLAGKWLVFGLAPGALGFSGWLKVTGEFFQVLFFVCLGFALLSLLLSLFEEPEVTESAAKESDTRLISLDTREEPRLWFTGFAQPEGEAREAA